MNFLLIFVRLIKSNYKTAYVLNKNVYKGDNLYARNALKKNTWVTMV